jgi:hypothetical protein
MHSIFQPDEPTSEQCSKNATVYEDDNQIATAIWYPSMGGYVGRAVAVMQKNPDTCVEVFVWHNGDFPFDKYDDSPRILHHCDPNQFVKFGNKLLEVMEKVCP